MAIATPKPARRSSSIWKFFKKDEKDSNFGICNTCQRKVKRSCSSTSNLRYHLHVHHPPKFKRLERLEAVQKKIKLEERASKSRVPQEKLPTKDVSVRRKKVKFEEGTPITITCTPFCKNCTIKHHPLLLAILNCLNESHLNDFDKAIKLYKKTNVWAKDKPVPDSNPEYQYPLVHWACVLGKVHVIKWLVKNGFNPAVQSSETKQSALHRCLLMLQKSCSGYAVKAFASVLAEIPQVLNVKDFEGNTPFLFCAQLIQDEEPRAIYYHHCFIGILNLLDKLDSEFKERVLYEQNNEGDTVAHILARSDRNRSKIMALDRAGMDLLKENKLGISPLSVAIRSGSITISKMIQTKVKEKSCPTSLLNIVGTGNMRRTTSDRAASPKLENKKSPKLKSESGVNAKASNKRRVLQIPAKMDKIEDVNKIEKPDTVEPVDSQLPDKTDDDSSKDAKKASHIIKKGVVAISDSVKSTDDQSNKTKEQIDIPVIPNSLNIKTTQKARKSFNRPKSSSPNSSQLSIEEIIKKFISQKKPKVSSTERPSSSKKALPSENISSYTRILVVPPDSEVSESSESNSVLKSENNTIIPSVPSIYIPRPIKRPIDLADEPSSTRENTIQPSVIKRNKIDSTNSDLSEERIKLESTTDLSETVVTSSLLTVSEPSPPILHPVGDSNHRSSEHSSESGYSVTSESALVKFIQQGSSAVRETVRLSMESEKRIFQNSMEEVESQLSDLVRKEVIAKKEVLVLEASILKIMQDLKMLQQKRDDKTKEHEKLQKEISDLQNRKECANSQLISLNEAILELECFEKKS